MSSDLVVNLRAHANRDNCVSHDWGGEYHDASEDCAQAAEEIERLRKALEHIADGNPPLPHAVARNALDVAGEQK